MSTDSSLHGAHSAPQCMVSNATILGPTALRMALMSMVAAHVTRQVEHTLYTIKLVESDLVSMLDLQV